MASPKLFLILLAIVLEPTATSFGALVTGDGGDLTIIDDAGNPSNGLRFLDMSFSVGLTSLAAITNAQLTYSNARLATPAEWDDLFAAAGIVSDNVLLSASDGFSLGSSVVLSSTTNYDDGDLKDLLGPTNGTFSAIIWTDPDGSNSSSTTRDYVTLDPNGVVLRSSSITPAQSPIGWLLVSEATAVPEPTTLAVLGIGTVGIAARNRRRRRTHDKSQPL